MEMNLVLAIYLSIYITIKRNTVVHFINKSEYFFNCEELHKITNKLPSRVFFVSLQSSLFH